MNKALSIHVKRFAAHAHGSSLTARFAVGAFWALAGAVVGRGATLLGAIIAARVLGTTAFGELGAIQSSIGMVSVFAGVGLGLTVTKHVAAYRTTSPERVGPYVALSLMIAACSGGTASLLVWGAAPVLAAQVLGVAHLTGVLRIATMLVVVGAIDDVQLGCLAGLERFRLLAFVTALRSVLVVGGQTLGAYAGLTGAMCGTLIAEIAAVGMYQIVLKRACGAAAIPLKYGRVRREDLRAVWRFALPALLSSMATQPALWLGNVLLVHQPGGYAALGVFVAADKWRQLVLFLPTSIASIVLPLLSNLYGTQNIAGYKHMLKINLLTNMCAVVLSVAGLIVFRRMAMSVYGSAYANGHETLVLLALSAVGVVLNNVLGQMLVSRGLIWWRCFFDVLLAMLLLVLVVLLIPTYHEQGMAAAQCAAYSIVGVALLGYMWCHTARAQETSDGT